MSSPPRRNNRGAAGRQGRFSPSSPGDLNSSSRRDGSDSNNNNNNNNNRRGGNRRDSDDDDDDDDNEEEEEEEEDGEARPRRRRLAGSAADNDEEEDGEDVYGENYRDDYRPIAALDRYDSDDVASDEDVENDYAARAAAEAALARQEEQERQRNRGAGALRRFGNDDGYDELQRLRDERKRAAQAAAAAEQGDDDDDHALDDVGAVNLADVPGPVREFLALPTTQIEVRRQFNRFLTQYKDDSKTQVYIKGIQKMCGDNKQSLEISYVHLSSTVPPLARFIVEHPDLILPLLHKELMSVTSTLAPNYEDIHPEVFVRVFNMPLRDSIRDLRQFHVNSLIRVWGVAVRRSGVFPQLAIAHYRCSCGESIGPVTVGSDAPAIARCPACQRQATNMALDTSETIFRNYQKVTLQEAPGSVPAGRVPRQVEVILLNDLIDKCAPGEEIEVTGVFKHAPMQNNHKAFGSPTFATILEANHVGKSAIIASSVTPTAADESEILSLSRMPKIDDMIARSIAPSIHGHEHIKRSIALSLFGGVPKENDETKNRLRGDINVLLLGDPGTAKSQFLKYTQKIATRAVFTTGKGASAVGLTASVRTDPMTGQFTLEGGAMVLSDQGMCLIDEFDKMSDQDRTSIHEAMEQQTISIAKAGIVCTLKARCSVIAAANPVSGRYNPTLSFQEQVNLSDPILSRFDVLCVVRDVANREDDRRLAFFIANSHKRATAVNGDGTPSDPAAAAAAASPFGGAATLGLGPGEIPVSTREERDAAYAAGIIPQDILRKYIAYARAHCRPVLANISEDYVTKFYAEMRLHARNSGGNPMTLRQVAGIIRMAEAHAKMFLRASVEDSDVRYAIRIMLTSFISTQKANVQLTLGREFTRYLIDGRDRFELLRDTLVAMRDEIIMLRMHAYKMTVATARSIPVELDYNTYRTRAAALQISNYDDFLTTPAFAEAGFAYSAATQKITSTNAV